MCEQSKKFEICLKANKSVYNTRSSNCIVKAFNTQKVSDDCEQSITAGKINGVVIINNRDEHFIIMRENDRILVISMHRWKWRKMDKCEL